jgi:hypothetical protein
MTNAKLSESEGLACRSENLALGVWEARKHIPPCHFDLEGRASRSAETSGGGNVERSAQRYHRARLQAVLKAKRRLKEAIGEVRKSLSRNLQMKAVEHRGPIR